MTTVIAFIVTIGVLITFHEAGHYLAARLCGVKILKFSIGFGKPLFSWKRKNDPDGTEWSVAALPLGGYVRMLDERDPACLPIKPEDADRTFGSKSVWQRFFIVAAGPAANLILAVLLFAAVFMVGSVQPLPVTAEPPAGTPAAEIGLHRGDQIVRVDGSAVKSFADLRFELINKFGKEVPIEVHSPNGAEFERTLDLRNVGFDSLSQDDDPLTRIGLSLQVSRPIITGFVGDSAAKEGGLEVGDEVISINGKAVPMPADLVEAVKKSPGMPLEFIVDRQGKEFKFRVTPSAHLEADGEEAGRIGASIGVDYPKTKIAYGFFESLLQGVRKTWETASVSLKMIGLMFTGDVSVKNISGPVSIADYAGQSVQLGFIPFLSFLAVISVSLGILNLLPIPMLDGGHLLYYSLEMIRGKPVSESFQSAAQKVGIAALLGLTVLALFNDLTRLFS